LGLEAEENFDMKPTRSMGWFPTLMVGLMLLSGCSKHSDTNQAEAETYAGLEAWGQTISVLSEMGINLSQYKTTEEVLSKWKNTGVIEQDYLHRMEADYWSQPFDWSTRTEGESFIVRVASWGRNGINENGRGDDLYVDVVIVKGHKPVIRIKGYVKRTPSWEFD
jgi:hypothetical protein